MANASAIISNYNGRYFIVMIVNGLCIKDAETHGSLEIVKAILDNVSIPYTVDKPSFTLRYTYDLTVAQTSTDLASLTGNTGGYLMHVIDVNGNVVWQSGPSQRYGDIGVNKK